MSSAMPRKSQSILIVEDDALLREAMQRLLEAEGHQVVKACESWNAATAIREETFDILIIDVLFPGQNTIQTLVVRSRGERPVRIIGLSRSARILPEYYLSLTAKLGVRVILAKPFEREQLFEAIEEVQATEEKSAVA
jgi:CheY-like chemotaxis protein